MENWNRYFIVDTSVAVAGKLRFGRGFVRFHENGEPYFTCDSNKVKLYNTQEEADIDFNKIDNKVTMYFINIKQSNVSYTQIKSK